MPKKTKSRLYSKKHAKKIKYQAKTSAMVLNIVPTPQATRRNQGAKKSKRNNVIARYTAHYETLRKSFGALRNRERFCDVTLVSREGRFIRCHKVILSSCSEYLDMMLSNVHLQTQHPVIFLKDVKFGIMEAICNFIYTGQAQISEDDLGYFVRVATSLKIKDLDMDVQPSSTNQDTENIEIQKEKKTQDEENMEKRREIIEENNASNVIKTARIIEKDAEIAYCDQQFFNIDDLKSEPVDMELLFSEENENYFEK